MELLSTVVYTPSLFTGVTISVMMLDNKLPGREKVFSFVLDTLTDYEDRLYNINLLSIFMFLCF
jgi:hypothetical protein